ncbi:LysM peptidoglycan-binding domain-containing protein [Cryobacterium arcticum]|uniref:LysM peptidoglycan-binding domain-containing protein n=1 Tax=Cryobacterium arcticum TaxID=670052 RepID=UPI002006FC41|nr:LysM peptidoglycan-binding domain-containing protein [Cryobacterium arcticum]
MSAAYAVKPGSIADSSATARQNGPRTNEMRRGTRAHLSIVSDVPVRAASAATSTGQSTTAVRTDVGQSATVVRTRLRLTRRGRVVFTALAAVPIVLGSIAIAVNGGVAAAEGTATVGVAAFEYVTIESGQSLWQLAESIAPSQDPRDVIADIVNLNQLPSEAVQPGQRIALPADY